MLARGQEGTHRTRPGDGHGAQGPDFNASLRHQRRLATIIRPNMAARASVAPPNRRAPPRGYGPAMRACRVVAVLDFSPASRR